MADQNTFSGEVSFHRMLQRAQEHDPVLTYWVCRLLLDIEQKKPDKGSGFIQSVRITVEHPLAYDFRSKRKMIERFMDEVFHNSVVHVTDWDRPDQHDMVMGAKIVARVEFVRWLSELEKLAFDDERHLVTIPN